MYTLEKPLIKPEQKFLGRHLLLELYECDPELLAQTAPVEQILKDAAVAAGATIVQSTFHQFNPYGVSGVVVIAESHITIHTWPEHGYAAVDVFTCDFQMQMDRMEAQLVSAFRPGRHERSLLERGHLGQL